MNKLVGALVGGRLHRHAYMHMRLTGGGMNKLVGALVGGRLALPAVVLAVIASRGLAANGGQASLNMVPREQVGSPHRVVRGQRARGSSPPASGG